MKVLVVGGGGREHAIIKKLKQSPVISELYCAPGNGGISIDAICVDIKASDISGVVDFVVGEGIDYVVVAPDEPLVLGMADALNEKGIRCFGPSKAASQIEGSKVFSKGFMKRHGIPTAAYESFDSFENARAYVMGGITFPVWIKTDGLALGKGAVIALNEDEALALLEGMMSGRDFGESGRKVVIEENMTGPEVTVLTFTDSKTISPMISSTDHKRALDGDAGLNTGGMGTIAPSPYYTEEIAERCMREIFLPTVNGMTGEGRPFKGCLYFGLMLTPAGPKVVEYNCRFGDPEAQSVLELLDTDLFEIMQAITDERLDGINIKWRAEAAACVILASGGYPEAYTTGHIITGLDEKGGVPGAEILHAGTKLTDKGFITAGGRVMGVTCSGKNLEEALKSAYVAAASISFDKMHYRRDIGLSAMETAR